MPDVTLQSGMTVGRAVRDPDDEKDDDFNVVNAAFAKFANLAWWNGERMRASMEEVKRNTVLLATVNSIGTWKESDWDDPKVALARDALIKELGLENLGLNLNKVATFVNGSGQIEQQVVGNVELTVTPAQVANGTYNNGFNQDVILKTNETPPRRFYAPAGPGTVTIRPLTKDPEVFYRPTDNDLAAWQGQVADKQLELTKIGHGLQVHLQSITTDHAKWFDGAGAVAEHQRDDQKDVVRNWT